MAFQPKTGIDDMVMLSNVSNSSIVDNLGKRYDKDIIYTYIGHVLISVNPFKRIEGLYKPQTVQDYRGKFRYEMPPHAYALADDMFRNMMADEENQCVIISGESGAGKTEASKLILQFIAAHSGQGEGVQRIKDAILGSNPLLEAFGNAKTIRNNNSSRFGKYMEIQFDSGGAPRGGRITNYLLEKSRVTFQAGDERNFHIFYQLLKGADAAMKEEFRLQAPDYYFYLNQGACYDVDHMDDVQEFKDCTGAMDIMNFGAETKKEILRLVSAIMWLGNISFKDDAKDQAQVVDENVLNMVAYLLQTDAQSLKKAITSRTITTGPQARGSVYAVPLDTNGAIDSRDALAKALYSRMFDKIVATVNVALAWQKDEASFTTLGILDIYGFEIFEKNGFEQMCINYVNEKLQQIFINLTLKEEQEEYDREGIQWEPIKFFNNKICCDLIESKRNPMGVFTLLDDTCNFPKGTDEKFLAKLKENHGSHAHFALSQKAGAFIIKHYAGDVEYDIDGFCERNKDLLFNDLINLAHHTGSSLIPGLFPESRTADDKRRPTTASFKIKASIEQLVDALSKCSPSYIRCIKPNDKKQANNFNTGRVTHQAKYLGLLENVKVRRAGYAYRQFYDKFYYRYAICTDDTWPVEKYQGRFKEGAEKILDSMGLDMNAKKKPYSPGKTKIFVRAPETVFSLEELRERRTYSYAVKIQRFFVKSLMARFFYNIQMTANKKLQGKKDRRRLSVDRKFFGDYIMYKENFKLKSVVGKQVKVLFADVAYKYDRKGKKQSRILVVAETGVHLIMLGKNKDKQTRRTKPFVYQETRRFSFDNLSEVVMSTLADDFMVFKVQNEHGLVIQNRKKTEILAQLLRIKPSLSVNFSDTVEVVLKVNKKGKRGKPNKFAFVPNPKAPEGGLFKKKKIMVPAGVGKDKMPNIPEPPAPPKASHTYSKIESKGNRPAPSSNPPPSGNSGGPKKMPMPMPGMGGPPTGARPKPGGGLPKPGGGRGMPMPPKRGRGGPLKRGGPKRGGLKKRGGRGKFPMPR